MTWSAKQILKAAVIAMGDMIEVKDAEKELVQEPPAEIQYSTTWKRKPLTHIQLARQALQWTWNLQLCYSLYTL